MSANAMSLKVQIRNLAKAKNVKALFICTGFGVSLEDFKNGNYAAGVFMFVITAKRLSRRTTPMRVTILAAAP